MGARHTGPTKVNPFKQEYAYLTTTGRKTGLLREIEIWFVERNGCIYILTEEPLRSNWLRNVVANPRVTIKLGGQQWSAIGRVLDPEQDADLYREAQALAQRKYGWGDGVPVEFRLDQPGSPS